MFLKTFYGILMPGTKSQCAIPKLILSRFGLSWWSTSSVKIICCLHRKNVCVRNFRFFSFIPHISFRAFPVSSACHLFAVARAFGRERSKCLFAMTPMQERLKRARKYIRNTHGHTTLKKRASVGAGAANGAPGAAVEEEAAEGGLARL